MKRQINFKRNNLLNINKLFLITLTVLPIITIANSTPCQDSYWWDSIKDSCILCQLCGDQEVVLRPCQAHKDTVCGSINDLEFDWNWLARTERKNLRWENENDELKNEIIWDWQAAALIMATIACLLFFIIAAIISIQHARQWRQIEKRFDADCEELSARLVARLNEQTTDSQAIFISSGRANERPDKQLEVRCLYLEQLLAGKNLLKNPDRGNLYTEEAVSTPSVRI